MPMPSPLTDHINAFLPNSSVPTQLQAAFAQMASEDEARLPARLTSLIPSLQALFNDPEDSIAAFRRAWLLMCAAMVRLDHYQDTDEGEPSLPVCTSHAVESYNLILSYYVFATHLLDALPVQIAPERRIQLYGLWSRMMLIAAAGQQDDLATQTLLSFSAYQRIAEMKTGAPFALAFGGTACLLAPDDTTLDQWLQLGFIYGTLVQYHDDILDHSHQTKTIHTLPMLIGHHYPQLFANTQTPLITLWHYLYTHHLSSVEQKLLTFPKPLRSGILQIFHNAFALC